LGKNLVESTFVKTPPKPPPAKKKLPRGYYDSRIKGNCRHPDTPYFVTPDHKMSVEFLQMWSAKREQWLTDTEDISDMWCRHCNLLFWSYDDLRSHYKSYLVSSKIFIHYWKNCSTADCSKKEDDDTKCFQCSKKFSSVKDLQRHIDAVHYKDNHECDVCGVAFSRNENLTRHKKLKHEDMPEETKHTCDECGKQFTRADNLKKHVMKLHSESDQNEFICHSCEKNFNKESNLKRHVENRLHKDGTVRNTCDQCGKQFCNERMLRAHMNMHHRESAGFEFASCDKTLTHCLVWKNIKVLLISQRNSIALGVLRHLQRRAIWSNIEKWYMRMKSPKFLNAIYASPCSQVGLL
jgi:hypothetical protein